MVWLIMMFIAIMIFTLWQSRIIHIGYIPQSSIKYFQIDLHVQEKFQLLPIGPTPENGMSYHVAEANLPDKSFMAEICWVYKNI